MAKTKSILFDFGGTLDSDGMNWKERFYPIYRCAGVDWTFREFERCFFASDDALTAQTLKTESFMEMLELQVTKVLESGRIHNKKLAGRIASFFAEESLCTLNRNKRLLRELKSRYSLAIVSNFYGNLPAICKELGLSPYFDVIIDSAQVGFLKPDPRIFNCALGALGAKPDQAVFVGDSVSRDMRGAKALGMPHVWLEFVEPQTGLYLKTPQPYQIYRDQKLKPCCKTDHIIHTLSELTQLLLKR